MYIFLVPLLIVILLSVPVAGIIRKHSTGEKAKHALIGNLCTFFAVLLMAVVFPVGNLVSAETAEAVSNVVNNAESFAYLAAALAVGLGSIGCGIAVSAAAPAAIGAVSEDPKVFSKALMFVALGEGVALYGFLIAFLIIKKF